MSDFPSDQNCNRTEADDQLDRLLASTDAELLTAISTAQTRHDRSPYMGLRPYDIKTLGEMIEPAGQASYPRAEEHNGAVLEAEDALDAFIDSLRQDCTNPSDEQTVEWMAELVAAFQDQLRSRTLTESLALIYLTTLEQNLELLLDRIYISRGRIYLAIAKQTVLCLFDRADDFGDCPVPSRS